MSTAEPLRKEGEEHLPPSLVALKRAAEARGIHVQLPPPGARPGRSTRWRRFARKILGRRDAGADPSAAAFAQVPDELLHLQRDLARRGITLRLPDPTLEWTLPEPVDLGVSVSDVVVRQRRGEP